MATKLEEATDLLGKSAQALRDYASETAKDPATAELASRSLNLARDLSERQGQLEQLIKKAKAPPPEG